MDKNKTLVIGASINSDRYSNKAIRMLQDYNHEIIAIGRREGEVGDVAIETDMKPHKDIDTVTMYIGPKHQIDYYDYIINLNPRRVIFNPGTENPEFYEKLQKASILVEVGCTLVMLRSGLY